MNRFEFIELASSLPEVEEGEHMGAADFRLRRKIFATLTADDLAGFRLTPETQAMLMERARDAYKASGTWGDRGWTKVPIGGMDRDVALFALREAWRGCASKRQLALLS